MITLAQATQVIDGALTYARGEGLAPMTVAVLDARGCVVALQMEDGSSLLRPDIASGKAWSALAMGFGTRNLAGRAQSLPSFFGALACLAEGRVFPRSRRGAGPLGGRDDAGRGRRERRCRRQRRGMRAGRCQGCRSDR